MSTSTRIPAPGFADPVHDAQRAFRAVLDALARPTIPVELDRGPVAPGALTRSAGALVLALCDDSTPLWLDDVLRADADVTGWIAFHTGAPIVADPASAAFAIAADSTALPALDSFALGTDEAPHTSTTVIACTADGAPTTELVADGPGFPEPAAWAAPVAPAFLQEWTRSTAGFPRGVDLVFAGPTRLTGLPRTTRL